MSADPKPSALVPTSSPSIAAPNPSAATPSTNKPRAPSNKTKQPPKPRTNSAASSTQKARPNVKKGESVPEVPTSSSSSANASGGGRRPANQRNRSSKDVVSKATEGGAASTPSSKNLGDDSNRGGSRRAKSPAVGKSANGRNQPKGEKSIPSSSALPSANSASEALDALKNLITDLKSVPAPPSAPSPQPASASITAPVNKPAHFSLPVSNPITIKRPSPSDAKSPPAPSRSPLVAPAMAQSKSSPGAPANRLPNPNAAVFMPSQQTLDQLSEEQDSFDSVLMPPVPTARAASIAAINQTPMGSFTAPRFAALAAADQQQQQQQQQQIPGRPVLAPTFTFGSRRRASALEQSSNNQIGGGIGGLEEDNNNRAQSFAGQLPGAGGGNGAAPGIFGLAARAHRRTGSEMSPQMAEQVRLQQQIEDLQRQQRELLGQAQALGNAAPILPNLPAFGTTDLSQHDASSLGRHRRIQSVAPSPTTHSFGDSIPPIGRASFSQFPPRVGANQQVTAQQILQAQQQQQQQMIQHQQQPSMYGQVEDLPSGHGRRTSIAVNKGHGGGNYGSISGYGLPSDWSEEGFGVVGPHQGQYGSMSGMASGGHSRQGSRAGQMDGSWRINGGIGPGQQQQGGMGADLAQAQAQLQSIASFRAAAGGGHTKMASFALPNMLPNMLYANAQPFLTNIPQQLQAFQLQIQQQSNQPQRKSLFSPYLPAASLPPLLAAGKLVIGILRVNKRNRSDAYISTEVLDADIYISGSRDRNRALDGDTVAVELLDVDEVWAAKKEKEDKKRKKEENAAYNDIRGTSSAAARKNEKKKDDVEVEGQGLMLFDDEEVTDEIKPQFAGHVVAVVERMPGQLFSGVLGLLRPSSAVTKEKQEAERIQREGPNSDNKPRVTERPKIVWFKPTDKRVPLIAIPTEQAPKDFLERGEDYANTLFCACIKRWPITSLHPFGTLVEEIGSIGQVEVETSALLKDCNFPTEDFTDSVNKCLPPLPWTVPEREIEARKDLRSSRVFTIDPETAKDLDDALSITKNEDGTFEVGVHIADVSYFVKPNTALDRDARKRATSVYLVQRAVPMLPPALSESLCSLVPGEERLAFSVFFTMTSDGRVVRSSFTRSVIKTCAKLSYGNAQNVIEGRSLGDVNVDEAHKVEDLESDIKLLQSLAKKLSVQRFDNGALRIDKLKLDFKLDDQGLPTDCTAYSRKESNSLVEEFMLLANMTAATMIAASLPEQALLRRHESPVERRIEGFTERAKRLGFTVDGSSAAALQKSFAAIEKTEEKQLMQLLSTKAMHKAKYFCSGMLDIAKYSHYALNTPLYTHFTSPIRRYADIIVHRQLAACLEDAEGGEVRFPMDRDTVAKTAQNCNMKKDGAKLAQEQSAHLYLCLLLHDLTERYGPVVREASVVNVLDQAFDVIVPEFGIEKRVHADQMPLENHVYDEHTSTLQLYWSKQDVLTYLAAERADDLHLKQLTAQHAQHAAAVEVSTRQNDENALFDDDDDEEDTDAEEIVVKGGAKKAASEETESVQRSKSKAKVAPKFEGLKENVAGGHRIQDIKELMRVPVIISADLDKSPPVIKVFAVNPFAEK